jgi:hypothetical protein
MFWKISLIYPEEDRTCLPNLTSGVIRSTARTTRAVTSAKARSGGIVFFLLCMYAISPVILYCIVVYRGKFIYRAWYSNWSHGAFRLSSSHQAKPDDGL